MNWIQFSPPMEADNQFALLWNYRRSLTVIEMLMLDLAEQKRLREAADKARDEMGKMLQEWIEASKPTSKKEKQNDKEK